MRLQNINQARHSHSPVTRRANRLRTLLMPLAAPYPALWGLAAAVAVLDAAWLAIAGLRLAPLGFTVLGGLVLALLLATIVWSRILPQPTLRAMALSSACLLAVTGTVGVLHYLLATLALPLADPMIIRAEVALGFDWRGHTAFLEAHPLLSRGLALAYHSSGPQIALVVIALSATRRIGRLWAFVRLFSVALICVVLLSAALPAIGPYAAYAVGPSGAPDQLETVGALWHLEPLARLRDGTMPVIALSEMRGLATFPSFHVSLALITAWALSPVRYLGAAIWALNAAVIVATLSSGGHYLPDVLAGALISLVLLVPGLRRMRGHTSVAAPSSIRIGPPSSQSAEGKGSARVGGVISAPGADADRQLVPSSASEV